MPLGILVEESKTAASLAVQRHVKALLVLTTTVASVTPPGACEGGMQTIYKEQALDCRLQSH